MLRRGVFVTGTDTSIGKTVVAACLVARWSAEYWKPVQTGLADEPGDSETVGALAGARAGRIHPPRHVFAASLSPEAAATAEDARITLDDFVLPQGNAPIVVEGAGGVLVPLCEGATMADLMRRLALPVLLVARGTLGTINHCLLSLEALRARHLAVAGVVFVGPMLAGNKEAVARLGRVPVWASFPMLSPLNAFTIAEAARALPMSPPAPARSGGPEAAAG